MFNQLAQVPYISNQFKLKKYLGLTDDEIKENEDLWRKENNYRKFNDDGQANDLSSIGVRADPDEMVNPEADADLSDLAEPDMGTDPINTDAGAATDAPPADGGLI